MTTFKQSILLIICFYGILTACSEKVVKPETSSHDVVKATEQTSIAPGEVFDLSQWSLTIPFDFDNSGSADTIEADDLKDYQLDEFFYLDENKHLVMTSPNKAITTPNSTNTRTEFRQVFDEDTDETVGKRNPTNYFALASHPEADKFSTIGGKLEATLKVNHVSLNAKYKDKPPAYSVVVGQIHAAKLDELRSENSGFGWGNEPLKIYYKKFPHHDTGSVFWNYERNLAKDNSNRIDIDYPVWGVGWEDKTDPKSSGISLGESFSYIVNVVGDIMYLEFSAQGHPTVKHQINLANNLDANGKVDVYDDGLGYKRDWLFFKAGTYNQCSTKDAPTFRYPACPGTGNWETDKANGNYASVTFSHLKVSTLSNSK